MEPHRAHRDGVVAGGRRRARARTTTGAPATTIGAACCSRAGRASHPVAARGGCPCSTSHRPWPPRSASTSTTSTGHRARDLVPARGASAGTDRAGAARRELSDRPAPRRRASRRWTRRNDVGPNVCSDRFTIGLAGAHHVTAGRSARDARRASSALQRRLEEVERAASVATVTAWLRHIDVPGAAAGERDHADPQPARPAAARDRVRAGPVVRSLGDARRRRRIR